MQTNFTIPNGSTPGWTPTIQAQHVVKPSHTVHVTQLPSALLPSQGQIMVVHPSHQMQYQMHMNPAGWSNQQMNNAQMRMACQTWKSDKKVPKGVNMFRGQQENVRLQQQFELLHSEYQAALIQIQTLTLQHSELDKKLKIDQWKYWELNNKFMIAMQSEQSKYKVLSKIHSETSNQLHREQDKCNALSINLEESTKNLKNEQKKYKALSAIHAETKKNLRSMRQKRDEGGNVVGSKRKIESDKSGFEMAHQIASIELSAQPVEYSPIAPRWNISSTTDCIQTTGGNISNERKNHLIIPPGFERCTRISGTSAGKVHRVVTG